MSYKVLLKSLFESVLQEVRPQKLISQACFIKDERFYIHDACYDLRHYRKIHLLGSGKAVLPMMHAMQALLGTRLHQCVMVGAYHDQIPTQTCRYIQSSHPVPTEKSLEAARCFKSLFENFHEEDLFIYLLSGGSSAMLELPEAGISLEALQQATTLMLEGGLAIEEINSVRKHLSAIKGGKLGASTKATGIVLVLSDVVGDDLHAIGSAPLYCDTTTFADAIASLKSHNIFNQMPECITQYLTQGMQGRHHETPKNKPQHIAHYIIGSNDVVLQKTKALLIQHQIPTTILKDKIEGDAKVVAKHLYQFAQEHVGTFHAYLFGGEPTVIVKKGGKGGRNQHLCLHFLQLLDTHSQVTFLSAATDGIDGNSDAAGAVIDTNSSNIAAEKEIDIQSYLSHFDSHTYFTKTGEAIVTGATHNNLLDIMILLIEPN
ncbi:glycerate kinase type-2 family protein [Sulfurospirillum sp. 1612]|uniref:glycerate kinase type-2 family protein n=1 Tax=Sulfurospirillum sp. 1612 TaxID=3094835 RepID=UPI002F937D09